LRPSPGGVFDAMASRRRGARPARVLLCRRSRGRTTSAWAATAPEERRRYVRLRSQLEDELRVAGLDDVADDVAADELEAARADPRLAPRQGDLLNVLRTVPRPLAVFVGPVTG
jgi:hypothetical protein